MTMVEDTWAPRDLPILVAAYRRFEADANRSRSVHQLEEIRREVGITVDEFVAGLHALADADPPYIEIETFSGWSSEKAGGGFVTGISERARRELGAWPTAESLADQLVEALLAAADRAESQDDADRLREAAGDLGSSVVKGVLVSLFTRFVTTGMPD
jgi:hypothetical protein